MKNLEIINQIEGVFGLNNLAKRGILPISVLVHKEIYLEYDKFIKLEYSKMDAASLTAERFKVSERTVFRAIKMMEQ
jgi:hypothetical protein